MRRRIPLGPFPHISLAVGAGLLVVALGMGSGGGAIGRSRPPATALASTVTTAAASTTSAVRPPVAALPAAPPPTEATSAPSALAKVVTYALAQLGKPYQFGRAGPGSFDCSGLTLAAFGTVGVRLPHKAAWQARLGSPVDWRREVVRPGDLVFTRGGRPRHDLGHVGLALSATEWVVAPSPGRTVTRQPIPFGRVQRVRRLVTA
jgi:cell wall-associated NlpC family hydrolase